MLLMLLFKGPAEKKIQGPVNFLLLIHNVKSCSSASGVRGVNGTILIVYPTRIVFDKAGMGKVFFSLAYWVWVHMGKDFFSLAKRVRVRVKPISYSLPYRVIIKK